MAKLCYKKGGTVYKYDLKDSVNTSPKLAVKVGGTKKYLGLKQGTKSGELSVKIGGQLYYVQTLDLGNAILDEDIKDKAFTQTVIHDRDYNTNFLAICFTNTNKQIVAILCFNQAGADRQGGYIDFSCFPTYFNPAETEDPGGTIKISTIEYGCPQSIKVSTLVNKLINNPWSPRIDGMASGIASRLKNANPRNNTKSTATSSRTSMLKNFSGTHHGYNYSSYLNVPNTLNIDSRWSSYYYPHTTTSRERFYNPTTKRYEYKTVTRTTSASWVDTGYVYNNEGINTWGGWYGGDGNRHWLTGGYNQSSMVLGYHNGYPMIANSAGQRSHFMGGTEHCRYSFIEYPGTQPLGMKPFDFISGWWTNVMGEHDATISVTDTCNTTSPIVPDMITG